MGCYSQLDYIAVCMMKQSTLKVKREMALKAAADQAPAVGPL